MVKLLIVDDHVMFRECLIKTLSLSTETVSIVGEAASGDELFSLLTNLRPDIVLLDIFLPDISGVEICHILKRQMPKIKVIVVSANNSPAMITELIGIGIEGFVCKSCPFDELQKAIIAVAKGDVYYGKDTSKVLKRVKKAKTEVSNKTFTMRELEIIELCVKGLSAREIGEKLNIAVKTVTTHKYNIFKKLGISNSVELVSYCLKNHIVNL